MQNRDWLEKGMILGDINIYNKNNFTWILRFKGKTINPTEWANLINF